jgi:hypothetical protein
MNGIINKILGIIIAATIAAWLVLCWVMYANMRDKNMEIEALQMQLAECGRQQDVIVAAIEKQNAAIESVRVDTVYVERRVKEVVQNYLTVRENVVKSIERDSTCENQLFNLTDIMRRFHGLAMRPEDGD